METGNSSIFLIEVVEPDVSKASQVDRCQLDQIDLASWCDRILGERTSRVSQLIVFLELDHEVLGSN